MAFPFVPVIGGISLFTSILGGGKQRKAAKESFEFQKKAYQEGIEEKVRTYEFNVGQTETDIGRIRQLESERVGDITREGRRFTQHQSAALGASGAVVGAGTPLDIMKETAANIERDILRTQEAAGYEIEKREQGIEFMKSEITEYKTLLDELNPKPRPQPQQPKKVYGTSRSGAGPGAGALYQ